MPPGRLRDPLEGLLDGHLLGVDLGLDELLIHLGSLQATADLNEVVRRANGVPGVSGVYLNLD